MVRQAKLLDPTLTGYDAEKLNADLHKRIVGQDEAIDQIVNIYQTYLAGMSSPGRPIGNFLFLGPTGSGKTRIVEATAEGLVGDSRAVIKIDCAEFQHSHEIAKLIGSPPGYLGHRETHPLLSQEVLNQYHSEKMKLSFVLFDEIEKASDALWNLLLGILDKATLTLGDNRRVDFSRAMIFMTSNLGAAEMGSILRPTLGFASSQVERDRIAGILDAQLSGKIARAGADAARRKFSPEFMNRIDKVVVFKPLGAHELRKILALELNQVQQRIFNSLSGMPFVFSLTDGAKDFLLSEGTDVKYGARHLKRAIDRALVHPLSNLIATQQVRGGDLIKIDLDSTRSRLTFFKEAEDMPAYAMMQMVDLSLSLPSTHSVGAVAETPRVINRGTSRSR
ncbi:MAG: ATP-dependent Clp protease ATP-binding subunit [Acidobacteria bacterium]|nr:ATP-dependent Clp protease ATP-binding subunit [Acidobacteriota bacterium]